MNGAVVAMTGKDCVAVSSDLRYGVDKATISTDFPKVFELGPHLYVGLPGLPTDLQTVLQKLRYRVNVYELRENRKIKPKALSAVLSNMLYEHRFSPFCLEPVVAGLEPKTEQPYVCFMDALGCKADSENFVVAGAAKDQLYGMCESLWQPDLSPEDLFEVISQAMMNALDREASAGCGVVVHIIEKEKVTTRTLKARMD